MDAVVPAETAKTRVAPLPLIVRLEAPRPRMLTSLAMVSWLSSAMVLPASAGAKLTVSPGLAAAIVSRSEPAP